jgi:hypothetical protein
MKMITEYKQKGTSLPQITVKNVSDGGSDILRKLLSLQRPHNDRSSTECFSSTKTVTGISSLHT